MYDLAQHCYDCNWYKDDKLCHYPTQQSPQRPFDVRHGYVQEIKQHGASCSAYSERSKGVNLIYLLFLIFVLPIGAFLGLGVGIAFLACTLLGLFILYNEERVTRANWLERHVPVEKEILATWEPPDIRGIELCSNNGYPRWSSYEYTGKLEDYVEQSKDMGVDFRFQDGVILVDFKGKEFVFKLIPPLRDEGSNHYDIEPAVGPNLVKGFLISHCFNDWYGSTSTKWAKILDPDKPFPECIIKRDLDREALEKNN